jgi:peptidoglycan/LPS O-acetylase OafA/YrhL
MLVVFLAHFVTIWDGDLRPVDTGVGIFKRLLEADASLGTNFFMVLSAFFAYGSLRQGRLSFGEFLRNRVFRLYPLYAILCIIYIVGSVAIPSMSKLPDGGRALALFLVQTALILPGLLHVDPLMEVAWTLSFIVWFYFIEGAVVALFTHFRLSTKWRLLLLLTAGAVWATVGDTRAIWPPRTALFWVGMVLSESISAVRRWRTEFARKLIGPAVALAGISFVLRTELVLNRPDTGRIPPMLIRVLLSAVLLFCFVWIGYFGPDWWKDLLSHSRLRLLGKISYSFYLTHGFAVKAFRYGIVPQLGSLARTPAVFWACQVTGLTLAIVVAGIAFRFIENPLAKLTAREGSAPVHECEVVHSAHQPAA